MTSDIDTAGCLNNCIETYSGILFDLIEPAGEVRLEDIAHGLANICRFGGQCAGHYSVAEHSVLVHNLISRVHGFGDASLAGLFHDAEEAYLGDMVRPLKQHHPFYAETGHRLQAYIRNALGIPWHEEIARIVKRYDNVALRIEAAHLMPSKGIGWEWGDVPEQEEPDEIYCYSPKLAKNVFLETYKIYQ